MLAKDGECKSIMCTYVLTIVILVFLFSKKKKRPELVLGKKLKSCATIAPLSIFSLGKGRETLIPQALLKTLKYCKVHFLIDPYNDLQCVCHALQNCPILQKFHVYSPRILHLSSNRREQISAPPFQFMTPGRELIQKSTKSTNFQHFHTPKVMNF